MTRQEILNQISQTLGGVPGWLDGVPDPQLEHLWGHTLWFLSDSKLSARDKAGSSGWPLRILNSISY